MFRNISIKGIFSTNFFISFVIFTLSTLLFWTIPLSILFDLPSNLPKFLLYMISIPLLLLGYDSYRKLSPLWKAAWLGFMAGIIAVFGLNALRIVRWNILSPPEWDMLAFWLDGQVAVEGLNFYRPESYQQIALPFQPGAAFASEILEVGFRYPPPTMLLFASLGLFNIYTATIPWYLFNGSMLLLSILLLWKRLFKGGFLALGLVTALTLMNYGTLSTFWHAQTTFFALLMFLLFWQDNGHWRSGIWLGIGLFVKPFLALILLYMILRRQWRAVLSLFLSLSAISIISILAFGHKTFLSYFTENPTAKLPNYMYTIWVNQSLLSTLLRTTDYDFSHTSPLQNPVFLACAVVMIGVTGWLSYLLKHRDEVWGLALTLLLALLLYPSSLVIYSVLLIMPVLLLWLNRNKLSVGLLGVTAIISVAYAMLSYNGGRYITFAYLFLWFILVAITLSLIWKNKMSLQGITAVKHD